MSNQTELQPISDEMLVAYLDGELSAQDAASVHQALIADADLRARRDLMMEGAPPFKNAFASLLSAAPEHLSTAVTMDLAAHAQKAESRERPWSDRRSLVAGLAAAAVLGPTGVWVGRSTRPDMENWREAVAQYHKLYSDRTLAGIADVASGHEAEIARVGREIGLPMSLAWLDGVQARYRRAQVLAVDAHPLAQIVLSTAEGKALAYCIRPLVERATLPKLETRADLSVAYWNTGTFGFLIVGAIDGPTLLEMAVRLRDNSKRVTT